MKRMFSKKGLVESAKDEKIEDVESDADLLTWKSKIAVNGVKR